MAGGLAYGSVSIMSPVLEHPTLRRQVIPMTVEMYHALGDMGMIAPNTELLRGCILPKMSKSPRHSLVTQRLLDLLRSLIPAGFSVWQEQPITCADSEPEPDIAVVKGTREDFATEHPRTAEIVVEVAVSTLERDMEKISIYAEAGVKEYWLVIPEERRVEMWSGPTPAGYTTCLKLGTDDTLISAALPAFVVSLREILA
jgi:Uma2 family endonuclease